MTVYTENDLELITILKDGHMSEQPAIAALLKIAIASGDFRQLRAFLGVHPKLLATAHANIRKAEWQREANPFMPPPPRWKWQEMLNGPIRLGYLDEARSMPLAITSRDLSSHMTITGAIGQGKTVGLQSFVYSLYWHRETLLRSERFNILIFDNGKREHRNLSLRCPNIKVIPVEQFLLSILKPHPKLGPKRHAEMVADLVARVLFGQSITRSILIKTLLFVYKSNLTPSLQNLIAILRNTVSKQKAFGMREVYLKLIAKLELLEASECFNCVEGIPFNYFQNHDLIIELDGLDPSVQGFVTAFVIRSLYMFNMITQTDGLKHVVINEEARELLISINREEWGQDSAWDYDLARVRSAGVAMIAVTQEVSCLSNTTTSNCRTKVTFAVNSGIDIDLIERGWGLSPEQRDFIFKLKIGQAIVKYGGYPDPLMIHVPMLDIPSHVSDQELESQMSDFWAELRQQIKTEEQVQSLDVTPPPKLDVDAGFMLKVLSAKPFLNKTELLDECEGFLSRQRVEQTLTDLERHKLIRHLEINVGGKRAGNYYHLLNLAFEMDGIKTPSGSGSFKHRLFQHLLYTWAEQRGAKAAIETILDQNPHARIDVLAVERDQTMTAYEVTISLEHLVENVEGDLIAGVDRVVVVCPDAEVREQAMIRICSHPRLSDRLNQIQFSLIWELRPNKSE